MRNLIIQFGQDGPVASLCQSPALDILKGLGILMGLDEQEGYGGEGRRLLFPSLAQPDGKIHLVFIIHLLTTRELKAAVWRGGVTEWRGMGWEHCWSRGLAPKQLCDLRDSLTSPGLLLLGTVGRLGAFPASSGRLWCHDF